MLSRRNQFCEEYIYKCVLCMLDCHWLPMECCTLSGKTAFDILPTAVNFYNLFIGVVDSLALVAPWEVMGCRKYVGTTQSPTSMCKKARPGFSKRNLSPGEPFLCWRHTYVFMGALLPLKTPLWGRESCGAAPVRKEQLSGGALNVLFLSVQAIVTSVSTPNS